MTKPIKAVSLLSGGLDSMLATKVIQDQGIHVEAINFFTGFCVEGHTHAIRKQDQEKQKRNNALWVAEQLGIKLHIIDVIEEYKQVVLNPKHGYGAYMNPCLDCKMFMVSRAKEWAKANGFDFIITGEVIGQRPMSQLKTKMQQVAEESQSEDILLRPLSAKNLPPTKPEQNGWVNREELFGFNGRNRSGQQIPLAKKYGFKDYSTPAGGCCFLTNPHYANKLKDLWENRPGQKDYDFDDIMLLKVGRHLRPKAHFKLIIGREEGENRYLNGYKQQFIAITVDSHPGPLALVDGTLKDVDDEHLAGQIMARYSQGKDQPAVTITIHYPNKTQRTFDATPLTPEQIDQSWQV